jgi:hypothetical protein
MAEAALPILLGGAASALGNYFGAQTAANAAKQSAALQQQRFNQAVGYEQPFMQAGQNALNLYNNATGVNGAAAQQAYYNSFQNDPGFQASVNYGLQQIGAQNAAQGMGLSGNALAALQNYSQNALSQQYQTRLQDLFQGAQLGANSANALTSASTSSASNQGSSNALAGQYRGASLSNTATLSLTPRTITPTTIMALSRGLTNMTVYLNISDVSSRQRLQPQNALLPAAPQNRAPAALPPAVHNQLLRSAIGHAAVLSDTPEKWAATIGLLKQHGVDPVGYEDFEKGRPAAIAASGVASLSNGDEGMENSCLK